MDSKKINTFLHSLLLITIATLFGCPVLNDCFRNYEIIFPARISPLNDTINVGDTLWFEMNVDNMLEDKATGEFVDLSDLDLVFRFGIDRTDTTEFIVATNLFNPVAIEGKLQSFNSIHTEIVFDNSNNKNFKMRLIPTAPGGYLFSINLDNIKDYELSFNRCQCSEKYEDCIEQFHREKTKVVINEIGERNLDLLEGKFIYSRDYTTGEIIDTTYWIPSGSNIDDLTYYYAFHVN